jgi:AcrR family transcriptional regulator
MTDRPTRTPSEKIKPEILSAALAILEEDGPDAFTVRAIALRANVAPMAIYNHFEGFNGVVEALWIEGFKTLQQAVTFDTKDPSQDLYDAALGYRNFALSNPGLYTIMFMHRFKGFWPTTPAAQVAAQTFQTMVSTVERCQAIGFFASVRSVDAAQIIWATCHGYVSLEILGINFAANRDETYRTLLTTLQSGFR